ncbi:hypothetical protein [Tunturibacter empetritectus]|uniref:Uncharacterized protein n=1 Tax=Tunturiibacter lichenicola TaxID=2051959 RepID=A0A7W8N5R1_9BACT|nr:hypothetical protein [Edaphobacter lichenicola]MBB5344270.1 hypothetical protein [Edaphobacter lichenicola]
MKTWALLSFTACGISLLLCGCGGGSTSATVSPLAGNWLLVGPMPTNGISFPPPSSGVRLAMTFDVVGDQVIAGGFGSNFCDNVQAGFGFGDVAGGILAADGSFTATPANSPLDTISIKGTAPKGSGEPWSGSYTVSLGGHAPACDANLSGTFTATSFPLVSGVYVGTGSTLAGPNGVPKAVPVTLQVTLQQGGTVANPGNGAASNYFSSALLKGSIKVQGSPCFSSGATQSTPASAVFGNMVEARFLMDDGSTLIVSGPLTDVTESHIAAGIVLVEGGKCGGFTNAIELPGLDRQS